MMKTRNSVLAHRVAELGSFKTLQYLLLILCGATVLFFAVQAVRFLPVTTDNVYPESAGVLTAQRWAQGFPLYADYRQPPYLMTPFTPFWYGVLALGAKAGIADLNSLVLFGRILTLSSLLGIGVVSYLWNRRAGFSRTLALLTPAFFLSIPVLIPWGVTARPDVLALLFALCALYYAGYSSSAALIGLSGVAASFAVLTKHNTVAVTAAIVLWLLWRKRWQHAAIFCTAWVVVAAAVLVPFQVVSGGLLALNLSGAKFGHFALTYVRDILSRLFTKEGTGFALALFTFGAFGLLQSLKHADDHIRLLSAYFAVSMALALSGSAAAGGGVNHYFEPALALALLIPVGMAQLEKAWDRQSPISVFAILITLALILPSLDVQRWNAMHSRPEDLRSMLPLITNRRVFSDDPYLAARTTTPQAVDLSSLTNTENKGGWPAWSSERIAKDLRGKEYELVILRTPMRAPYFPYDPSALYPRTHRLDSAVQTAISNNYNLCLESAASEDYGQLSVYSPRQDASSEVCAQLKQSLVQFSFAGALNPEKKQ
jgi:hypothetical protein